MRDYRPLQREYARLAARYDQRWQSYVQATVRETLQRITVREGERILDIGCGTGALLATLARKQPHAKLSGVDFSSQMLSVAARRLPASLELRQAPAEALPFPAASFDRVISTSAFHYFRDPEGALGEMKRVLRPGGQVVITDWCHDFLTCRLCDLYLRLFSSGHFRTYGTRECRRLLTTAGFARVRLETYRISWLWGLMTAIAVKP
jgi:ubiquinone/menaquinone biosynthesis C-methylase UbiE